MAIAEGLTGRAAPRGPGGKSRARVSWLSRVLNNEDFNGYLFILPMLVGVLIFILYPMLASLYLSFTKGSLTGAAKWVGLANFRDMFDDRLFWFSLRNTAYFTLASLIPGVIIPLALALAMNQRLKGIVFYRFILFLPTITSTVAIAVMWGWIYNSEFGILNQILRGLGILKLLHIKRPLWLGAPETAMLSIIIMSVWRGLGYTMLLFLASLQDVPEVYHEAAKIDGAGSWARFLHITWPLITPMTFFVTIMDIIGGFQVFEYSFVLTGGSGGPVYSTLTMVLYLYNQGFKSFQIGYASALAYVLFAIILVLTIIQFRIQRVWVFYE